MTFEECWSRRERVQLTDELTINALVGDEVTEADDVGGELVSELNSFSSTPALLKCRIVACGA